MQKVKGICNLKDTVASSLFAVRSPAYNPLEKFASTHEFEDEIRSILGEIGSVKVGYVAVVAWAQRWGGGRERHAMQEGEISFASLSSSQPPAREDSPHSGQQYNLCTKVFRAIFTQLDGFDCNLDAVFDTNALEDCSKLSLANRLKIDVVVVLKTALTVEVEWKGRIAFMDLLLDRHRL